MPGIAQTINSNTSCVNVDATHQNSLAGNVKLPFWSQQCGDVSQNLLQEFWCELSLQARKKLLRIDKQTLFEHSRKNMYCSRCNGLLLEGFSQIVIYGKSLQHGADGSTNCAKATHYQNDANLCTTNGCQDNVWNPSLHPWGGLTTTRDGKLTLLDCYLYSKSLNGLQNVFDYARARERERELLYPDACGGGGRGWITQGVAGYGRGHGTRDTCALHTARLSVETLVDFWSALGAETRQSLLRMKEDDFIERLIHRFESKRFCRDCRRNVIREFKELKELKRMRKQTHCTSWFCVADTTFQCQVSRDTVHADWHQTFSDAFGKYHHFEWAIGSGDGKSDILEFENVGLSGKVQANGLDLSGLNACYITLRAWRMDGRCNELCVKAHALRDHLCVHCRLVVGDGFLTITRGESMTRFFEHAEEAEEEEDDDSVDKDGNDLDGECSRPQKHAKSPELAREFLLDAATVIFKEQVEKAFREGTARQNSHSIFVCLALKLLEERVHVACKDIITLEKQTKLLEEEEREKREEEERKERRRTKEREKKLRRKERLKEKETKEKKCVEPDPNPVVTDVVKEVPTSSVDNVADADSGNERSEDTESSLLYPDIQHTYSHVENPSEDILDGEFENTRDWNTPSPNDNIKYSHRKQCLRKDSQRDLNLKWSDRRKGENGLEFTRSVNAFNKQLRSNLNRFGGKLSEKIQCTSGSMIGDRYDSHSCTCNHHHTEYRSRSDPQFSRVNSLDISKPYHRGKKYNSTQVECNGRPKIKIVSGNTPKKVWEPLDSQKKCIRSNSDSDFTMRSTLKVEPSKLPECCSTSSDEAADISVSARANQEDNNNVRDSAGSTTKPHDSSTSTSSNSDNFSSCLSDGDTNLYSKSPNSESTSTSDSEEVIQVLDGKQTSDHPENPVCVMSGEQAVSAETNSDKEAVSSPFREKGRESISNGSQPQSVLPQIHSDRNINYPLFQASTIGYYHPNPVSWTFPYSGHYSFPRGFEYGLNGNAQFVQYGAFRPLTPPIINRTPAPVFQPISTNATGLKEVGITIPKATDRSGTPADKKDVGNDDFSLFHFGGPVGFSTGFKASPMSLNEGIMEDMKKSSVNCPDDDHPCGKKDSVEEYNLFAATNGIKFSIF